ncbi:MAG: LysR family transcriptional regulator, partial [Gammaproteobacteria bacterium]
MTNWDDIKFLMLAAQCGSYSQAARELGVNRTTVARRIAALEAQLGTTLLEPSQEGYQLTEAGTHTLQSARNIGDIVQELEDRLASSQAVVSGALRVALPLGLGPEFMPELQAFAHAYPEVTIELLNALDPMALVHQRKADAGIGLGRYLPAYLKGHSLGTLQRALYASRDYLAGHPATLGFADHLWVGWGHELAHSQAALWMEREVPAQAKIAIRVNSWHALREAVRAGMGVGQLWCFLADPDPLLASIRPPIPELDIQLWILSHEQVTHNRRVQAFTAFMHDALGRKT